MGQVTPWTLRLRDLVSRGPVPYNRVLSEMIALVPPGRGFRNADSLRAWERQKFNVVKPKTAKDLERDKDMLIAQGRSRIAHTAIWTQEKDGRIETYYEGDVKMIRQGGHPAGSPAVPRHGKRERQLPKQGYARMTPMTRHIWARLAKGPVNHDIILEECLDLVSDDQAMSTVEASRSYSARRANLPLRPRKMDSQTMYNILSLGRRRVVATTLSGLAKRERIAFESLGNRTLVIAGPRFWIGDPPPDDHA